MIDDDEDVEYNEDEEIEFDDDDDEYDIRCVFLNNGTLCLWNKITNQNITRESIIREYDIKL